jgi:hypothetical protein
MELGGDGLGKELCVRSSSLPTAALAACFGMAVAANFTLDHDSNVAAALSITPAG